MCDRTSHLCILLHPLLRQSCYQINVYLKTNKSLRVTGPLLPALCSILYLANPGVISMLSNTDNTLSVTEPLPTCIQIYRILCQSWCQINVYPKRDWTLILSGPLLPVFCFILYWTNPGYKSMLKKIESYRSQGLPYLNSSLTYTKPILVSNLCIFQNR